MITRCNQKRVCFKSLIPLFHSLQKKNLWRDVSRLSTKLKEGGLHLNLSTRFICLPLFFFSPGVLTCRDAESVASTISQMWKFLVDYLAGTLHFRLKLEPIRHLTCSRTHSGLTIIIFTPAKRHFRCSHSFSFGLKIRICKYLHKRILSFLIACI